MGRELAMRWTKGKHQFIVASHINTKNPHAHIVYNSVNLDCNRKFEDFKRSAIALRRLSDQICLENGLSIIENPGLSKGFNRGEYLGEQKQPTVRDNLRDLIDDNIVHGKDFESFIVSLKMVGCEVKRGKHLAIKIPNGKRFIRLNSLGEDYSENALLERISGKRIVEPKAKTLAPPNSYVGDNPNLLVDIQAKIQEGYGVAYENWAKIHNLKQASKTLVFLQENGLDDYNLLTEKSAEVTKKFNEMSTRMKFLDNRKKEIKELQKQIGAYSKTKDIYSAYKQSYYSKKFYEQNDSSIIICEAAKKYFNSKGYGKDKKLPNINNMKKEYAIIDAELKKIYSEFKPTREKMIALSSAKQNVDSILGEPSPPRKTLDRNDR